ncbi:MAG TPA: tripartite tricarboxylate transporter substrate binding protein [Alphaproteobacteria bacterium]
MILKQVAAALIAVGIFSAPLHAAGYPERAVDMVLPYPAGGGIDLLVRVMAEGYSAQFRQPFTVSNRTGAGGAIGIGYVARATADGYTLLFAPALAYSVLPLMQANVGYSNKSFVPICQAFENQMALIVPPDSPFKSARDIVEAARGKPPAFAATAPGTITHLAAAALADAAKVNFNHVPFRGDAELMGQVIGGHVDFASTTLASAAAAGPAIRVLAIFAEKRNPSLPDTPTVKEQGYDVAPTSFGGLFAPAGVPADVVGKLATGCKLAVEQPAYVNLAKRLHQGSNYYAAAATFAKRLEADVVDKRDLLRRVGLIK